MKFRNSIIACVLLSASALFASRAYYVDSVNGNDENDGLTEATAWASITRLEGIVFGPGDAIRLARNSVWHTPVSLTGEGSAEAPVTLTSYGLGRRPYLEMTAATYAIDFTNIAHWDISNLEISNRQPVDLTTGEWKDLTLPSLGNPVVTPAMPEYVCYVRPQSCTGVRAQWVNCGEKSGVKFTDLYIHDVEGRQDTKENGGIVLWIIGNEKPTRVNDLEISRNRMERVCRSGIVFVDTHWLRSNWYPCMNVHIGWNYLNAIGGDAITPWACDGVVVEYNFVLFAANTSYDCNAGIWPWSCDNAVFRRNVVAFTRKLPGNGDGQGFDVDTNNRNTIVEENLSYQNGGGFILICGEKPDEQHLNAGITVRNNISIGDGGKDCLSWGDGAGIFTLWNNLKDINIYNNTVFIEQDSSPLLLANWGSPTVMPNMNFFNNAIFTERPVRIGPTQDTWSLRNNVFITPLKEFTCPFANESNPVLAGADFQIPVLDVETFIERQLDYLKAFRFPDGIRGEDLSGELKIQRDYFGVPATPGRIGAIE